MIVDNLIIKVLSQHLPGESAEISQKDLLGIAGV
jgi:hypothetical protein